jgi:hypothetical protein
MKPWMLDALIGIGSLVVLVLMLKVLPLLVGVSLAYISALLLFVLTVCTGGFLVSRASSN